MENQDLKLDYIKLTPRLIQTINCLQTGGTYWMDSPPEDKQFDNSDLKDSIDRIIEVCDFIVYAYSNDPKLFAENQFGELLITLFSLKDTLNDLAAPEPEKQTTV